MTGTRTVVVSLMLAFFVLVAASPVAADHEARSMVTASGLLERPARGLVLVVVTGRSACTGFVIGRRKVATAAHCLVRDAEDGDYRLRRGLPAGISLYRRYSAVLGAPGSRACGVARLWAHPRFVRSGTTDQRFGSRAHDYAVLTLATACRYPRDTVLRLHTTSITGGELPDGRRIAMAGYPNDARFDDMDGLHLWRMSGHVEGPNVEPARLDVSGFAAPGMSGAPVWTHHASASPCGQAQCVVAILTECEVNSAGVCRLGDSPRRTVRITAAVRDALLGH